MLLPSASTRIGTLAVHEERILGSLGKSNVSTKWLQTINTIACFLSIDFPYAEVYQPRTNGRQGLREYKASDGLQYRLNQNQNHPLEYSTLMWSKHCTSCYWDIGKGARCIWVHMCHTHAVLLPIDQDCLAGNQERCLQHSRC